MSRAGYVNGVAGHYTDDEKRRAGIDSYSARAATKTKANSTLFLSNLGVKGEANSSATMAERIFAECPGYFGVRPVRSMVFVDFDSIMAATNAMLRFQGHRPVPGHTGLVSHVRSYCPAFAVTMSCTACALHVHCMCTAHALHVHPIQVIDYDKDVGKATKRRAEQAALARALAALVELHIHPQEPPRSPLAEHSPALTQHLSSLLGTIWRRSLFCRVGEQGGVA